MKLEALSCFMLHALCSTLYASCFMLYVSTYQPSQLRCNTLQKNPDCVRIFLQPQKQKLMRVLHSWREGLCRPAAPQT